MIEEMSSRLFDEVVRSTQVHIASDDA